MFYHIIKDNIVARCKDNIFAAVVLKTCKYILQENIVF